MKATKFFFPEPIGNRLPKDYILILSAKDIEPHAAALRSELSQLNVDLSETEIINAYCEALHLDGLHELEGSLPLAVSPWQTLDRLNATLLKSYTRLPILANTLKAHPYPEQLTTLNLLESRRIRMDNTVPLGPEPTPGDTNLGFSFPLNTLAMNESLGVMDKAMRDRYLAEFASGKFRQSDSYFRFCELTDGDPTSLFFIESYLAQIHSEK